MESKKIEVRHASALSAGHGKKRITVELAYGYHHKEFSSVTNNMHSYDCAMDEEDLRERYWQLYNLISAQIEEEVLEWIAEVEDIDSLLIAEELLLCAGRGTCSSNLWGDECHDIVSRFISSWREDEDEEHLDRILEETTNEITRKL